MCGTHHPLDLKFLTALQLGLSHVRGALSGLRQVLAADRLLDIMKNTFYFTLKVIFFKIFKFLPGLFSHVEKWPD